MLQKNNFRNFKFRILLIINLLILISILIPINWNPIFIINNYTVVFLIGDINSLFFWFIIFFILILRLYKKDLKFIFLFFSLLVFITQIFFLLFIWENANNPIKSGISFVDLKTYTFLNWNDRNEFLFQQNFDPKSLLISPNIFGIFNYFLGIITLVNVSWILSISLVLCIIFIIILYFTFYFTWFLYNKRKYIKIKGNTIKTFFIGSYNKSDLEKIEGIEENE